MNFKKAIIVFLIVLSAFGTGIFAQHSVEAVIDRTEYSVGDLIEVSVNVTSNPGLHGLFFDLEYNADVLEFDDITEGDFITNVMDEDEFLYAVSDDNEARVIASYTLKGNAVETANTGNLVKIRFRVKNQGLNGTDYGFRFNTFKGIFDGSNQEITNVTWIDTNSFTIKNPFEGTFILIKEPYDYQVLYGDETIVNLICSTGDFKVKLQNLNDPDLNDPGYQPGIFEVSSGVLLNQAVNLSYGFNRIEASLYDVNDNLLSRDVVKIYRSDEDKYIKIVEPLDHSLVNTDKVSITVYSPFDNVYVNGTTAEYNGEIVGSSSVSKVYKTDIWLKEGFNTITATVNGPENTVYKDTITVYYQKDDTVFSFISPRSFESFKSAEDQKLLIKGEIGSKVKVADDPALGGSIENVVTLKVIYKPSSPYQEQVILVDNKEARIIDSDYGYGDARSKYVFYNDFDISLDGLKDGEIEIIAYKNKEGLEWDDKINRTIYIDNNRLWINLVQPNVFTYDLLDTNKKIKNFNENIDIESSDIELTTEGSFKLKSTERIVTDENLKNVVDIIERYDGSLYALVNDLNNGRMKIYKKQLGDTAWELVVEKEGVSGYQLCDTDIGILIGISGLFNPSESGLCLLRENQIEDIYFNNEDIKRVQFIQNNNGRIFIYGNNYNYLYGFNTYSIEEDNGQLKIINFSKIGFSNSFNIKEFILTNDSKTAVIRTDNDEIFFYQNNNDKFEQIELESISGKHIILGEYEDGDYNVFLVVNDNKNVDIIMENKKSGDFVTNSLDINTLIDDSSDITFTGIGFKDNNFIILYTDSSNYFVKRGQIFFDKFFKNDYFDDEIYMASSIDAGNYKLFVNRRNSLYIGFGESYSDVELYGFYNKYKDTGILNFNYVNDDIDGLTGFSFEFDPGWLDISDIIKFGFHVKEKSGDLTSPGDPVSFGFDSIALENIINEIGSISNEYFTVTVNYDDSTGKDAVHFEFAALEENKYINFDLQLNSIGNSSPEISELKVYKKIRAKIITNKGENVILPVHGYIYDKTVTKIAIQNTSVDLERNGAFYHNLDIDTSEKTSTINMYCMNGIGQTASLDFTVDIIDSTNDIMDIEYKRTEDADYNPLVHGTDDFIIQTAEDTISLKGKYFGLVGAVVGYEIQKYGNIGDEDSLYIAEKGIFDLTEDASVIDLSSLGSGYTAGYFEKENIKLVPGSQKLVIYCENPGGFRVEYTDQDKYPEFMYNLPEEDQEIIFHDLTDDISGEIVNNLEIKSLLKLDAFETEEAPYSFINEYEISGEIKSLYYFSELNIRSFTEGLTFENDLDQITVPVEAGNRFKFKVKIAMGEEDFIKDFYFGAYQLDQPLFSFLKKGARIRVKKSFAKTNYIPDFSEMDPAGWTEEQKDPLKIPVKLKFNRDDMPTEATTNGKGYITAKLLVNYEHYIEGIIYKDNGFYYLKDVDGGTVCLTAEMIKQGKNRIGWSLVFTDLDAEPVDGAPYTVTISHSNSGNPGMEDYIFDYSDDQVVTETVISFSPDLTDQYYNEAALPKLNITKDEDTGVEISLNSEIVNIGSDFTALTDYDLNSPIVREGKNTLVVTYNEPGQSEVVRTYTFLFDSQDPVVNIESYKFTDDFTGLVEITVSVTEANYCEGFLYYGNNIINELPDLIIKSENKYQLTWKNLDTENIIPSDFTPVKIKVDDRAGNTGESSLLKGFSDIERPGETEIKENAVKLKKYDGNPELANEANYTGKEFNEHTKFAPEKFLKRISIKEDIKNNGNYLIKNETIKNDAELDPAYWSKCESLDNIIDNPDRKKYIPYKEDYYAGAIESVESDPAYTKWGNGLRVKPNPAGGITYYLLGDSQVDSLTISTWIKHFYNENYWKIGTENYYYKLYKYQNYIHLYVNGVFQESISWNIDPSWQEHYYVVVDKNKKLDSGLNSMKLYINGELKHEWDGDISGDLGKMQLCLMSGSSGSASEFVVDNIKVWDYVVDDNTDWLWSLPDDEKENELYIRNDITPVYWTKCESLDNITVNPEIGNEEGSYYAVNVHTGDGMNGTNRIYASSSTDYDGGTYAYWSPQGNSYEMPRNGVLSYWMMSSGIHSHSLYLGAFKLFYSTSGLRLYLNGQIVDEYLYTVADINWHHIYTVWDEQKNLSNGKSIIIYVDGNKVIEIDNDLSNWDFCESFKYDWWDSSDYTTTAISLDNVKMWNNIVSEDPKWALNDADITEINVNDGLPVYWSKCESEDNLTGSADAKEGNPQFTKEILGANGIIDFQEAQYNNGLRIYGGSGSGYQSRATLDISDQNGDFSSFTASFYLNAGSAYEGISNWNSAEFDLNIGNLRIWTYDRETHDLFIYIDGAEAAKNSLWQDGVTHHIYVIADTNGINGGADTVRVYVDGKLFCSTNQTFNAESCIPSFKGETNADNSSNSSYVLLDNIKIWDYIISEDPASIGSTEEISTLPDDYGKYLVFKIAKDKFVNNINTEIDITDKITFEVVGKKYIDNTIEEVVNTPIVVDTAKQNYIEGENHLYYILDAVDLKNKFDDIKEPLIQEGGILDPDGDDIIVDSGSLRINYYDGWTNFSPADIYLAGNKDSEQGDIYHSLKDIIVYESGYESQSLVGDHTLLHPEIRHDIYDEFDQDNDRTFIHDNSSDSMTVTFWSRVEDEGLLDEQYSAQKKRILTFCNESGNELVYLYYNKNILNFMDDLQNTIQVSGLLTGKDEWNMITLKISKISNEIQVYVNGQSAVTMSEIDDSIYEMILNKNSRLYFGAGDTEEYNSGFFSIANPFYIDRLLTDEEITRLFNLRDQGITEEMNYNFTDGFNDFGIGNTDLHKIGENDHFIDNENADYSQNSSESGYYGSLKACTEHKNFLKIINQEPGKNYVVFETAGNCITNNINLVAGENSFELIPSAVSNGKYYFGDKTGNYGLGTDKYYSISGKVESIGADTEAYIVLRINSNEQRYKLQTGSFHFIYNNEAETAPNDVKLYIDTNGSVTLSCDMSLNEGNYIVQKSFQKTAASTIFPFNLSGTIAFWYKPLNANKDGFVNYESILFDSEYLKIGTKLDGDDSVYYGVIKKSDGTEAVLLDTKTKVTNGWQYIQVSYSQENDLVYFYIDGNIAAESEETLLPVYGSLEGNKLDDDNIFIGCDMDHNIFAEGFFDSIFISKYYHTNKYSSNKPLVMNYDKENLEINVDFLTVNSVQIVETMIKNWKYRIDSLDSNKFIEGESDTISQSEKISLSGLTPGRYRCTVTMKVNNHNYREIINFNIDEKPKFDLVEKTPIVFASDVANIESDVKFRFRYDDSYRFKTESLTYSGAALRINYNSTESETQYLVQDFLTQNNSSWLIGIVNEQTGLIEWTSISSDNSGLFELAFEDLFTSTDINYEVKYFYFTNIFEEENKFENIVNTGDTGTVPLAKISSRIETFEALFKNENDEEVSKEYEYKLAISVVDSNEQTIDAGSIDVFKDIVIGYVIDNSDDIEIANGDVNLDENGKVDLFYDDILPGYDVYTCKLILKHNDIEYAADEGIILTWEEVEGPAETITESTRLEIEEFSILYMDKANDKANLYIRYDANNVGSIASRVDVIQDGKIYYTLEKTLLSINSTDIYRDISIPKGASVIKLTIQNGGFICSEEIQVNNFADAPEIILTNWVENNISYNNVFFSWKGTINGKFDENIEYSYNFDNNGWTTPNKEWRSVRLYNLDEGYHSFEVKAFYNDVESIINSVRFFVDVNRPEFIKDNIIIEKLYDTDEVFYAVNITGQNGAINDASLKYLYIDGKEISFTDDGSFSAKNVPITKDGMNSILITAIDKVGNFTDYNLNVENYITQIIFPSLTQSVKYCPMTIVGRINGEIDAGMNIYVKDVVSTDKVDGDYSGWKKAKINEDRTFFIEDVFINPGAASQEIVTTIEFKSVFDSGKEFSRTVDIRANEIVMPIELTLSTHAAEGENSDTYVEINCKANVPNISSWSVDFDGDGVYDMVNIVDNPELEESKSHNWSHKYSSLGIVEPRVRIVTTEGNFFSVSDRLIIHEKIKEASNKMIEKPRSLSVINMPDNSKRIYVLKDNGTDGAHDYAVEVYEVGRTETYISDKKYTINISSLGIDNPVIIRAYDEKHFFIGANINGEGFLYELVENDFGNFEIKRNISVTYEIRDITNDKYNLFISFILSNSFIKIPVVDGMLDTDNLSEENPVIYDSKDLGSNTGIAKDGMGLLISDYYNQRIIRLNNNLNVNSQFGSIGLGEKEFLKPALIKSYENRIFIYDEARKDIQVFDLNYKTVCVLQYSLNPEYHNYLEPEFFNDIADIDIICREENSLLYYYALILSRSTGKLAMLRLPQWEELRAKVRNNKIVFIQDGEIFTSKPDGGDLKKILSSDSIPRIEGTLDYPALSPDGKSLVFTSRMRLYNGEVMDDQAADNEYAYDDIYVIDIETKELKKISLGDINGYEIERPVFNSNGDKLIFSAKETGKRWQIYIYDFETAGINKLFDSDENMRFPYYSPDDRFVVFTTDYDGNEEIEIMDTENTSMRVKVTSNSARDSLPVWNTVYPFEILDSSLKIESKISFVSERDYHKGVYYVYLSRSSDSDIRVVKHTGDEIGNDPDSAAIEITNDVTEGDYPCFTGDGQALVFEYFDGEKEILKKCDFIENLEQDVNDRINRLNGDLEFILNDMELPGSAKSPAGMKNMIANFRAFNKNGDEIQLLWNRYTENDIFYEIYFKKNEADAPFVEKKVFSQTGEVLKGLEMGVEYLVKVCIVENNEEVATTQWKNVKMPEVIARPTVTIDEDNPYLVHLNAWKPELKEDEVWMFSWIIDNQEMAVQDAEDYVYEFATSGTKTITLKASDSNQKSTNYSAPVEIEIISDIEPVIEYVLAEDSSYIELSAENSKGKKIDFSSAVWTISGPGRDPIQHSGSVVIPQLNGFQYKINVNLKLQRKYVIGQQVTDIIEKNLVIDLDYKEVKPVITYKADETEKRLLKFSGEQSKGNIDWYRAKWTLFANNGIIYSMEGISTFEYLFPETNEDTIYSVSLNVPRRNDGMTETVSQIICVDATPIEPVIDYQIMTIEEGSNVVGAKLLLDCTKSTGSEIDFSQARWSVPVAGSYGEQPTQFGPTALYNLMGADEDIVIEVALTLSRKGGTDPMTITKLINIKADEIPQTKLVVTRNIEDSTDGKTVILDVLKSTGPNINWENTDWTIDGQPYDKKGAVARIDVPASSDKKIINYVCTLYRYGAEPLVEQGTVEIDKTDIIPLISYRRISGSQPNVYELSILDTKGVNIDWERTDWFIYDGNENVIQKRGAKIAHAFAFSSEKLGYPVMVEVYMKGSSYPYVNYTTIDVVGDELRPIITYDTDPDNPNTVIFNATTSKGSNIDWTSAKWTFGDSSEYQYGSTVNHKYALSTSNREYRVTLTLTRKSVNGSVETKTVYKDITIGKDDIKPKIKAKLYGDGYLVLTAEDSEGRGLLLDRSVWLFEGKADNETIRKTEQSGVIAKDTFNLFTKAGVEAGYSSGDAPGPYVKVYGELGFGYTKEVTNYLGYGTTDYAYSSSNIHNGAVCRKFVGDLFDEDSGFPSSPLNVANKLLSITEDKLMTRIKVTLFVYRMTPEGGITGESITVNIDLDEAKEGVTYGK